MLKLKIDHMKQFIKNNAKYLTIGGAFTLLVICYFQQKENAKLRKQATTNDVDSLVNVIKTLEYERDSLSMELFPMEIELNRYQTAYKIFVERDPQGAKIYSDIISDETE
jgi:hypothetical protein